VNAKENRGKSQQKRKDLTSKWQITKHNLKIIPKLISFRRKAKKVLDELPDTEIPNLPDSETIYSWIEELCSTPHRRPGTSEGHKAEDYLVDKLKQLGLENVTKDPIDITVWDATNWDLLIEENGRKRKFPCFYVPRTKFTGPEGITGKMIYLGEGTQKDFKNVSVKDRIVVVDILLPVLPSGIMVKLAGGGYYLSDPEEKFKWGTKHKLIFIRKNFPRERENEPPSPRSAYFNAFEHGAKGIILILKNHPSNTNSHYGPYDRVMKPMPGLWVGQYDGEYLREMAKKEKEATIIIEGTQKPGVTHNVWGYLPGVSEETLLISSHHDSPFKGATEDGTGISLVLAQAWAWSKLPKEKRPKSLLFVCDAGHFYEAIGAEYFVKQHPELIKKTLVNVNLEHLAAKEVVDNDGKFEFTGSLAVTLAHITSNEYLISVAMKALDKYKPKQVCAVPFNLTGSVAPGDGGRYYQFGGLNVINMISMPYYLLTAEDTLDKVDKKELTTFARTAAEIISTLMYMDKEQLLFMR